MELPSAFKERMERMLGTEYEEFLQSYEREQSRGLRLNLLKTDPETFLKKCPFSLQPVPWAKEGYYYGRDDRPGRHPYHEAGVYYIQEPSAMAAVSLLDPRPGERILDLCAAPGGKTTQIASRMAGGGLLISNEIHPARAKILSRNVERMGITNAVVTNEEAKRLAEAFPAFFDRILVDAPCSGEGMFRKDEESVKEWSPQNVQRCAARQRGLLSCAASMLKPGGRIVYSTCTFAPEENEGTVQAFLSANPAFSVLSAPGWEGLSRGVPEWAGGLLSDPPEQGSRLPLKETIRIWPHKARGEGHYIAALQKGGLPEETGRPPRKPSAQALFKDKGLLEYFYTFCRETLAEKTVWPAPEKDPAGRERSGRLISWGDQLYLLPSPAPALSGLRVIRPGLCLGSFKKNRFEPSHALALALKEEEARCVCRLDAGSPFLSAYLRGESLSARDVCLTDARKGWVLISADGYCAGWAKLSGGILKNHYPKGLRAAICGQPSQIG